MNITTQLPYVVCPLNNLNVQQTIYQYIDYYKEYFTELLILFSII